jgi:hypothetical protein
MRALVDYKLEASILRTFISDDVERYICLHQHYLFVRILINFAIYGLSKCLLLIFPSTLFYHFSVFWHFHQMNRKKRELTKWISQFCKFLLAPLKAIKGLKVDAIGQNGDFFYVSDFTFY